MTPLQFAKAECSNYREDRCLGLGILDNGRVFRFRPAGQTCLLASGQRCQFFEECVAPMHTDTTSARGQVLAKERADALREYRLTTPGVTSDDLKAPAKRLCPKCKTRHLEPRKQLCYVCHEENRKITQRERKRKERDNLSR